jgi:hypothetical protein
MGTVILNIIPDFFVSDDLFDALPLEFYFSHTLLGYLTVLDHGSFGTRKGNTWNAGV